MREINSNKVNISPLAFQKSIHEKSKLSNLKAAWKRMQQRKT
jgi:hypothetical protein